MNRKQNEAAKKLAQITIDSDSEWEDLEEFIKDGGNPYDHALCFAHIVFNDMDGYEMAVHEIKIHLNRDEN